MNSGGEEYRSINEAEFQKLEHMPDYELLVKTQVETGLSKASELINAIAQETLNEVDSISYDLVKSAMQLVDKHKLDIKRAVSIVCISATVLGAFGSKLEAVAPGECRIPTTTLNFRSSPEIRSDNITGSVDRSSQLSVLEDHGEFIKVQVNSNGAVGFVAEDFTVICGDSNPQPDASAENTDGTGGGDYQTTTSLNLRSQSGTDSEVIGILDPGTSVQFTGRIDGEWYEITVNGQTGWVHSDYLVEVEVNNALNENTTPIEQACETEVNTAAFYINNDGQQQLYQRLSLSPLYQYIDSEGNPVWNEVPVDGNTLFVFVYSGWGETYGSSGRIRTGDTYNPPTIIAAGHNGEATANASFRAISSGGIFCIDYGDDNDLSYSYHGEIVRINEYVPSIQSVICIVV